MAALSQSERRAGRQWVAQQQALLDELNATDPPALLVPPFGRHFRHNCASRDGRSTSFELKERYVPNPAIVTPDIAFQAGAKMEVFLAAGVLAWIYKEGRCHCGLTARSLQGFYVDARERPPLGRT